MYLCIMKTCIWVAYDITTVYILIAGKFGGLAVDITTVGGGGGGGGLMIG